MATWTYSVAVSPTAAPTAAGLAHDTQHTEQALGFLLEQFKTLPRMEAMLGDLVDMQQGAEDLAWEVLTERYLETVEGNGPAEGIQIDLLGEILGEPRAEKSDAVYLKFLRVRILVNNSDGLAEQLIDILVLIGSQTIDVQDLPPAGIYIEVTETEDADEVFRYLSEAKAAGVNLIFVYTSQTLANTFHTSGTYSSEEAGVTDGFSSTYNASSGGYLAGVFD